MFFSAGRPSSSVSRKFSSRTEFWMALAANSPHAIASQIAGHTAVVMRVPMPSRGAGPSARGPLSGAILCKKRSITGASAGYTWSLDAIVGRDLVPMVAPRPEPPALEPIARNTCCPSPRPARQ